MGSPTLFAPSRFSSFLIKKEEGDKRAGIKRDRSISVIQVVRREFDNNAIARIEQMVVSNNPNRVSASRKKNKRVPSAQLCTS